MPKRKGLKNRNDVQEQQPEQQEQQSMLLLKSKKLLMPNANPPTVVHTPDKKDNIEWTLLATLPDYEEMDKFRAEKQCKFTASSDGTQSRIRHYCNRRYQDVCKFMLLAIKTTTNQYHVYTHGDHTCKKTGAYRPSHASTTELMPDANPPTIFHTPDNIEWTLCETFSDYHKMRKFQRKKSCSTKSSMKERLRFRSYCYKRSKHEGCKFMLLSMKTEQQHYYVYKYGKHNHPVNKKNKQKSAKEKQQNADQHPQVQIDEDEEEVEVDVPMPMDDEQHQQDENEPEPQLNAEEAGISEEDSSEEDALEESEEEESMDEEATRNEAAEEEEADTIEQLLIKGKNGKVHKWMGQIDQNQIGETITGMDKWDLLRLVEMADQEIRQNKARLEFWHPWLKRAVKILLPQIQGFTKLILMVF